MLMLLLRQESELSFMLCSKGKEKKAKKKHPKQCFALIQLGPHFFHTGEDVSFQVAVLLPPGSLLPTLDVPDFLLLTQYLFPLKSV